MVIRPSTVASTMERMRSSLSRTARERSSKVVRLLSANFRAPDSAVHRASVSSPTTSSATTEGNAWAAPSSEAFTAVASPPRITDAKPGPGPPSSAHRVVFRVNRGMRMPTGMSVATPSSNASSGPATESAHPS